MNLGFYSVSATVSVYFSLKLKWCYHHKCFSTHWNAQSSLCRDDF